MESSSTTPAQPKPKAAKSRRALKIHIPLRKLSESAILKIQESSTVMECKSIEPDGLSNAPRPPPPIPPLPPVDPTPPNEQEKGKEKEKEKTPPPAPLPPPPPLEPLLPISSPPRRRQKVEVTDTSSSESDDDGEGDDEEEESESEFDGDGDHLMKDVGIPRTPNLIQFTDLRSKRNKSTKKED